MIDRKKMNKLVERERERGSKTRATEARRVGAQFFIPPLSHRLYPEGTLVGSEQADSFC